MSPGSRSYTEMSVCPVEAIRTLRCPYIPEQSWGHRGIQTSHCRDSPGDIGTCDCVTDILLYERSRGHRDIRTSHCTNSPGDIGTCDCMTDICDEQLPDLYYR